MRRSAGRRNDSAGGNGAEPEAGKSHDAPAGATFLSESNHTADVPMILNVYLTPAASGTNIALALPPLLSLQQRYPALPQQRYWVC
jgi:hypothetical protein